MSQTRPTHASSSNFQVIFNNALRAYEKQTKKDLLSHPLAAQLQGCDSPSAILDVLHQKVQELDQSQNSHERLTKWLDPTVNVLYALSDTIAGGVSLVFSPATVIFAGVGVLLSTVKDVQASYGTLIDIFERIENFFRRLENYAEVPPTPEMMDMIGKIMVEVLSILAMATKEIKQGRTKKIMKRIIGKTDVDDALKRLDKLTQEEARMATSEVLKATHKVDNRVRGVSDQVTGVDDRVAGVDERVKTVANKVSEVIDDGKEAKAVMDEMKRTQSWGNIHKWLSPPDPSSNHNIACATHQKRTANWFFQGGIFTGWKSTDSDSLLWIHGKPGSGKSILCSTIIQDVETLCKAGQASMAYFYFDFRDAKKQNLHDLVPSLLTQLSARSAPRCGILSKLYLDHNEGTSQPSDDVLSQCLKDILALPDEHPVYLIIDALDECPDLHGMLSPRERLLQLIKELVELRFPYLHICVTSRPEIDIREVLEPLTSRQVSLHDQTGQKQDISDYIRSVVYSNSEPIMKRWRTEDKELVIETLSDRANGMFRWVYCQLETLRRCLPPSIRRTLGELPESLDETYERVLKEIKKSSRDLAHRLLQCLVVAIRPLQVEELVEVLAVDFDDSEGIPKLNVSWRWEDHEQALLLSCSSLISIVKHDADNDDVSDHRTRVVQFSHFSVKEFLTSPRLASPSRDVSLYHIVLEPAHVIMAQACLAALLRLDEGAGKDGTQNSSPLATYAATHWVAHAHFQSVSSQVRNSMECFFDPKGPSFAAWLQLYDMDTLNHIPSFKFFLSGRKSCGNSLYYAALCGFQGLVEHLITKYPDHAKAIGGYYQTAAVAALAGRHFELARLLHLNGSSVDPPGSGGATPLYSAAYTGDREMVQGLLDCKADINSQNENGTTPLMMASAEANPQTLPMVRLLLENGADPNVEDDDGMTSLHVAVYAGSLDVVRLLLEHGANVEPEVGVVRTPLQIASEKGHHDVAKLLSEHGAKRIK